MCSHFFDDYPEIGDKVCMGAFGLCDGYKDSAFCKINKFRCTYNGNIDFFLKNGKLIEGCRLCKNNFHLARLRVK